MRRFWSLPMCAVVATLAAILMAWPFCSYLWTLYDVEPYDPVTGAHPVYVSAPIPAVTDFITGYMWKYSTAVPDAVFGALVGIVVFAALSRFSESRYSRETRCSRCAQVLSELSEPRCPACGEPL